MTSVISKSRFVKIIIIYFFVPTIIEKQISHIKFLLQTHRFHPRVGHFHTLRLLIKLLFQKYVQGDTIIFILHINNYPIKRIGNLYHIYLTKLNRIFFWLSTKRCRMTSSLKWKTWKVFMVFYS